jgi:hypothetical protein
MSAIGGKADLPIYEYTAWALIRIMLIAPFAIA